MTTCGYCRGETLGPCKCGDAPGAALLERARRLELNPYSVADALVQGQFMPNAAQGRRLVGTAQALEDALKRVHTLEGALADAVKFIESETLCTRGSEPNVFRCFNCDEFMDDEVFPRHGSPTCQTMLALAYVEDKQRAAKSK